MAIGDRIAYLIQVREGGNRSEFARKIGIKNITSGLAHDWVTGRCKPKGEYRLKICEVYGVSLEWLQSDDLPVEAPVIQECQRQNRQSGDESALVAELRAQIDELKKDKEVLQDFVRSLQETNRTLAEAAQKSGVAGVGSGVYSKVRG